MYLGLVDDDLRMAEILGNRITNMLHELGENGEMLCFDSAGAFLDAHRSRSFDAVFLDIDMPEMTGFELTEKLRQIEQDTPIVYVTAHDDLFIHAFQYRALGFVRKAKLETDLPIALQTIMKELRIEKATVILHTTKASGGKEIEIRISDIVYIESRNHLTYIHMMNGEAYESRKALRSYEESPGFFQFLEINSGTLVNPDRTFLSDDHVVTPDGIRLFISKRKRKAIQAKYLQKVRSRII